MKRKEKISVCIAYAMLSKIRKLKTMSGQGDKFRIPWKMLQSYEHLHREKTRQLVDEYLYIKKAVNNLSSVMIALRDTPTILSITNHG